jgi:hypothetical protein
MSGSLTDPRGEIRTTRQSCSRTEATDVPWCRKSSVRQFEIARTPLAGCASGCDLTHRHRAARSRRCTVTTVRPPIHVVDTTEAAAVDGTPLPSRDLKLPSRRSHKWTIREPCRRDRRMLCRFAGLQSLSLASRHLLPKERRISLFKARTTAVACGDSAVKSERSDEMLTGQRGFDGPTSADVLAAVLRARARFAASRDAR